MKIPNSIKTVAFFSGAIFALSKQLFKAITLMAVVTALIIVFYILVLAINGPLKTVDKTVLSALIVAFFSLITFLLSKFFELRQHQIITLRENKAKVYSKLSELFFALLKSIKLSSAGNEQDLKEINSLVDQIYSCNKDLIVWGSDDVVTKFVSYRENYRNPDLIFSTMGNLFLSIRKDLGHKNKNLPPEELLKIFVDTAEINRHQ